MSGIVPPADERENRKRLWFSSPPEIGGNLWINTRKKDGGEIENVPLRHSKARKAK